MTDYKNLIDGEMVDNGEWLEVLNPANEQVVGRVPACGKDELDRAVAARDRDCVRPDAVDREVLDTYVVEARRLS